MSAIFREWTTIDAYWNIYVWLRVFAFYRRIRPPGKDLFGENQKEKLR